MEQPVPVVVRRRDGWWWWHCRPCARTDAERVLSQPLAVEAALLHLGRRHGATVGFRAGAVRP